LLFIFFASEEQVAETEGLWRTWRRVGDEPVDRLFSVPTVLLGGVLDGAADHFPPRLESRLGGYVVARAAARVSEQDGEERGENPAAVSLGPGERVGVFEVAVLGVGSIDGEADDERARGHVATGGDVVAGEDVDGAASGGLIALPIAVIGAILTVVLVHTLEEHRAGRLGEKAFLTVVKDSFAQLRLIRIDSRTKAGRHD
jgi:hypothetical protein